MSHNTKIRDLDELAHCIRDLKTTGKKVVLAHGVFDMLHVGHIRHLEQAKQMGDVLVVTLTPDKYVNKGPNRPAFPQELRTEVIASLGIVDYVAVNRWPLSVETIKLLKPDIYAKGQDYKAAEKDITGGIVPEMEAVRAVEGEIRFTEDIVFSSSNLINRFWSVFPPEVECFLEKFRQAHSADEVLAWLDKTAKLRPLVVGEAIIDEYLFCSAIGKSTKDPVLAVLQETTESYAGGSLAVANHLAALCPEVTLVTQLGEMDRAEDFVRQSLRPNIQPIFLTKHGAPTIHKRRVVDRYTGNKLLELYEMSDTPAEPADATALHQVLEASLPASDATIVTDYGHGMFDRDAIRTLCARAPFLAVNAQSNAGNRGFNPICKYHRAHYVCIARHELELEMRSRDGDVRAQTLELARRMDCPRFTVTLGKAGSLHYDPAAGFTNMPALATRVLDRVGAGDAVLAVTTLLVQAGAPWDVVGFVGNAAGAQLVAELGNRVPLDRVSLTKFIATLMK